MRTQDLGISGTRIIAGLFTEDEAYAYDVDGPDCNGNGRRDACDIAEGTSPDVNANGIPDECECVGDVDADGEVDFDDLLRVLFEWGLCPGCPEDIDGDGFVGFEDMVLLLANWGPCRE